MSHDIVVCIPCKLVIHGERNLGIHTKHHHKLDKLDAENQRVVVRIGVCRNDYWNPCKDPHNRPTTEQELQEALRKKEEKKN